MPPTVDELHPTRPQTGEEPLEFVVEFVRRVHPDIIYRVAYLSEAAHEEGPPVAEERYMVASTKQGGMMEGVEVSLLGPPPAAPPCKARATLDTTERRFSSARATGRVEKSPRRTRIRFILRREELEEEIIRNLLRTL